MSRQSVALLKGLGILLIITHNYMHWLPRCVDENEYSFSLERINRLILYIEQGGPHVLLNLLSHYGHYGVAIFLFVSGYGLTMKYEQPHLAPRLLKPRQTGFLRFTLSHALKLWKLMIPAVLLFVCIELYIDHWNRPWQRLLPLLGFYSNLQPERDLILGPWWWFGLMMQFYILWRLIIYKSNKATLYIVMTLCLLVQISVAWLERGNLASTSTLTNYLHYNFPCSMLAFGLGVAHARYNLEWLRRWWTPLVGITLVIIGSFNAGIWCIAPMGAIMTVLPLAQHHKPEPEATATHYITPRSVLVYFGRISAWLFALHPVVRAYAIKLAASDRNLDVYLSILVYLGASIAAATLFTVIFNKKPRAQHNK